MTPIPEDAAFLWDMLQSSREVVGLVEHVGLDEYLSDRMRQLATERAIEIIGEAARRVSDEFQHAHPEIPWRPIVAQRHVLAHDYGRIDQEKIWRVATIYVPDLVRQLEPLVPSPPPVQE